MQDSCEQSEQFCERSEQALHRSKNGPLNSSIYKYAEERGQDNDKTKTTSTTTIKKQAGFELNVVMADVIL